MAKIFIYLGISFLVLGLLWSLADKMNLPLGSLPGDINIKRGNTQFSFPIVTCIIISVGLSLLMYLIRYFQK